MALNNTHLLSHHVCRAAVWARLRGFLSCDCLSQGSNQAPSKDLFPSSHGCWQISVLWGFSYCEPQFLDGCRLRFLFTWSFPTWPVAPLKRTNRESASKTEVRYLITSIIIRSKLLGQPTLKGMGFYQVVGIIGASESLPPTVHLGNCRQSCTEGSAEAGQCGQVGRDLEGFINRANELGHRPVRGGFRFFSFTAPFGFVAFLKITSASFAPGDPP